MSESAFVRAIVAAHAALAILAGAVALLFAFNWLVPAPDSSISFRPLYPLGMVLFSCSSIAFLGASRAFATGHALRWILVYLAIAFVTAFYFVRFEYFAR